MDRVRVRTRGNFGCGGGEGKDRHFEVVFRNGLRLGRIERGRLVEVVGECFLRSLAS